MNNKKTSFDDANFKVVLKKFLRDWSALEYEDNPPSALAEENRYAQYGIKLPFKWHYKYKMPFGFEDPYVLLFWLANKDRKSVAIEDIKRDLNLVTVEDILKEKPELLNDPRMKKHLEQSRKRLDLYQSVSPELHLMIVESMKQISSDQMIAEIKRLNPELAQIKTDGKTSGVSNPVLDFVHGVAYGFAPEDIELCLTSKNEDLWKIANNPRYQNLRIGHFSTPEHYEALLVAEQQIQQIEQAKQNNGRE